MVINEIDEVLFWNGLSKLYSFIKNLNIKYHPNSSDDYFKEKMNFYIREIGTKSD